MQNLVFNAKERTQNEGVRGKNADENIWTQQTPSNRKLKNCIMRSFTVFTFFVILLGASNRGGGLKSAGRVSSRKEIRNGHRILVGKPTWEYAFGTLTTHTFRAPSNPPPDCVHCCFVIRKRQRSATYMQLQSKNFLTPFLHYT
jgi:hypothetical protein